MLKLLPPLQLYKSILRAHRILPTLQKELGDSYVKNEFRLHQKIDNPVQIVSFLVTWQDYLEQITGKKWQQGEISQVALDKLSQEQVLQVYELMKETKKLK